MSAAVRLRETIETAASRGGSLGTLTVMSGQTDPYRIDTPANRRDAEWLAAAWEVSRCRRPIHLRGLHYALVSTPDLPALPDGQRYLNTDDCWIWLQGVANRARWLGAIDFEDVVDERNAAPEIHTEFIADADDARVEVEAHATALWIPQSVLTLLPSIKVDIPRSRQAYRLVLVGEKQSLADVLLPIAYRYRAELVLPSGEISTTLLYGIAKRAAADGRPCRIFYFSDFDPAGFHMPIEVSRKLQALTEAFFPEVEIQLRRCALTAEQVRDLGLPSTPMKETERRAARWRERFGVEQTEIDALATLRPLELNKIAKTALAPYWDDELEERTQDAIYDARQTAERRRDEIVERYRDRLDNAELALAVAHEAANKADADIAPLLAEIVSETEAAVSDIPLEAPEAAPDGDTDDDALFCSRRDWVEQTAMLRREKL